MNSVSAQGRVLLHYALEQKIRAELADKYALQSARGWKQWQLKIKIDHETKKQLRAAIPSAKTLF